MTLERRWLNNKPDESCIPVGEYLCKRYSSPKYSNTFEVTGVTGRTGILLHKGNLLGDSHGCIILGESFERINGVTGIGMSGLAFEDFMKRLEGQSECKLVVEFVKSFA